MELTDLVMLDIKHIDPEKHKELTSQPNEGILAFAEYLNEKHVDMWIRHVIVPGITDDDKFHFPRVGVMAVSAPHRTALHKDHEPGSRTVYRTKTF